MCYALGKELPVQYIHPSKIVKSKPNAKLIAANDQNNTFSEKFKGRFSTKEEALSISADFSEKMHTALKWLIAKQGLYIPKSNSKPHAERIYFDTMVLVTWASKLRDIPDILNDTANDFFDDEQEVPSTGPMYANLLKECIWCKKETFKIY